MVRAILEARNRGLLRDLRLLLQLLADATTPDELLPYRERVESICRELEVAARRNLAYLALGRPDILPDVLSATGQATYFMRLLGTQLAPPVLRASSADRLCLTTLRWLHCSHAETADFPPAFSDREIGIWPFLGLGAPLYFFPSVEQRGLLYLPLLFHEFGHLLYSCHKPEMADLVVELQRAIHDLLLPASRRNDRLAVQQAGRRQEIVDAWYSWAQELFCDAAGFAIGGPSFLHAFSTYVSQLTEPDFYQQPKDLRASAHPVTWLRIQFLARRAGRAGFPELAEQITDEWSAIAATLGIREDYHGFYVADMEAPVERAISDMLTDASPRPCTEAEAAGGGWSPGSDSIVRLLNWAWQIHTAQPDAYAAWEEEQLGLLLAGEGI